MSAPTSRSRGNSSVDSSRKRHSSTSIAELSKSTSIASLQASPSRRGEGRGGRSSSSSSSAVAAKVKKEAKTGSESDEQEEEEDAEEDMEDAEESEEDSASEEETKEPSARSAKKQKSSHPVPVRIPLEPTKKELLSASSDRLHSLALTTAQVTLRSMYDVVDAAVKLPLVLCPQCKREFDYDSGDERKSKVAPSQLKKGAEHGPVREQLRLPRILVCGHSICQPCVESKGSTISCPVCSVNSPAANLPINASLLSSLESSATFLSRLQLFSQCTQRLLAAASFSAQVCTKSSAMVDEVTLLETELNVKSWQEAQKEQIRITSELTKKDRLIQAAKDATAAAAQARENANVEIAAAQRETTLAKQQVAAAKEAAREAKETAAAAIASANSAAAAAAASTASLSQAAAARLAASMSTHHQHQTKPSSLPVALGPDLSISSIVKDLHQDHLRLLQKWLGKEHKLSRSELLFRASRDGWTASDFFKHCSDRGSTLMLVRVAGSKFIFGAFTNVSWFRPATIDGRFSNVFDKSNKSFLFSLTNTYKYPFRMKLRDEKQPALIVHATLGPMFGGHMKNAKGETIQWPNLSMMWNNKHGNEKEGNIANDPVCSGCAYQLDESELGTANNKHSHSDELSLPPPPPDFRCDHTSFGGKQFFACEEMEVYQLEASK